MFRSIREGIPLQYELPDSDLFRRVNRTIDPRCEMYRFAVKTTDEDSGHNYYFYSAHYLVERLLAVIAKAGISAERSSLLDFAAGYGRFSRFFIHVFENVTTSDLDPEMLRFCHREFGTSGLLSSMDPASVVPTPRYDVVFCFSMFTHLPERLWRKWLDVLWGFVRPGGLLVFSTRSPVLGKSMDEALGAVSLQKSVFETPYQPRTERVLQIFGIRLSTPTVVPQRGLAGEIRASVRVNGSSHISVGPVLLDDSFDLRGVQLYSAEAKVTAAASSQVVTVTIPFRAFEVVTDSPIGAVRVPISFESPSMAFAEDCPGSPTVDIEGLSRTDAGISFRAGSEAGDRIDRASYGITTVTGDFVRSAVAELPLSGTTDYFAPGDMDLFQDVFIVAKNRVRSL
jgi:2-polyprenyl-3-methyl-5-hydroxy-6-metoxy-1,4-benzoquinol methylase